jgi:hypothetical protein
MTEIREMLLPVGVKLNHPGLDKATAKSTASDGLLNRDSRFFENMCLCLVGHYRCFYQTA